MPTFQKVPKLYCHQGCAFLQVSLHAPRGSFLLLDLHSSIHHPTFTSMHSSTFGRKEGRKEVPLCPRICLPLAVAFSCPLLAHFSTWLFCGVLILYGIGRLSLTWRVLGFETCVGDCLWDRGNYTCLSCAKGENLEEGLLRLEMYFFKW